MVLSCAAELGKVCVSGQVVITSLVAWLGLMGKSQPSQEANMASRFQQREQRHLALMLDALDGLELTAAERRTLEWLAGRDDETVNNVAAMITKARLMSREALRE
jgi:hypothetical protein